jgi:ABC-type multidrug transport system ATPase subunit
MAALEEVKLTDSTEAKNPPRSITLECSSVSYEYAMAGGDAKAKASALQNFSGKYSPGQLVAILGPSGSGKTTLLSIMAGRQKDFKGSIKFNGAVANKRTKRMISFVTQDDLMHGSLTVRETLTYAGLLRLPGSLTRSQKLEQVESVINQLKLTKCADSIIGGMGERGISGGERKRVAVGCELLTNPSILFLDEYANILLLLIQGFFIANHML